MKFKYWGLIIFGPSFYVICIYFYYFFFDIIIQLFHYSLPLPLSKPFQIPLLALFLIFDLHFINCCYIPLCICKCQLIKDNNNGHAKVDEVNTTRPQLFTKNCRQLRNAKNMGKFSFLGQNTKFKVGFVLKECVNFHSIVTKKVCIYDSWLGMPGLVYKLRCLRQTV